MRKLPIRLRWALLLGAAQGWGGGYDIGTGQRAFVSDEYGFKIQYDTRLTFSEEAVDRIRLDDSQLVESGQGINVLSYRVMGPDEVEPGSIRDRNELERFAHARHSTRSFEAKDYPGAVAVESWTPSSMLAYLLLQSGRIVEAELRGEPNERSRPLLTDVIRSFAYDYRAPVFLGVAAHGSIRLGEGQRSSLLISITDDASGVDWSTLAITLGEANRSVQHFLRLPNARAVRTERPNEWRIDFELNAHLRPGEYSVENFYVRDYAKLRGELRHYFVEDKFYQRADDQTGERKWVDTDIPFMSVNLEAAGSPDPSPSPKDDTVAPKIHELRPVGAWKSGEKAQIVLRATDDKSGVLLKNYYRMLFYRLNADGTISGEELALERRTLRPGTAADDYVLEGELSPYRTPGTYIMGNYTILDNAGNYRTYWEAGEGDVPRERYLGTDLPVLRVRIENEGLVDADAPRFKNFRFEDGDGQGRPPQLFFEVEETVSGVDLSSLGGETFTRLNEDGTTTEVDVRFEGRPRAVGPNTYSVDLHFGAYVAPGRIRMDSIGLEDIARNEMDLRLHEDHYDGFRMTRRETHFRELPVFTFEFRRPL